MREEKVIPFYFYRVHEFRLLFTTECFGNTKKEPYKDLNPRKREDAELS